MMIHMAKRTRMSRMMKRERDNAKERFRIAKEKANAEKQLAGLMGKLNNPGFLANAPEAVVAGEKEKAEKLKALVEKLTASEAAMQAMKK